VNAADFFSQSIQLTKILAPEVFAMRYWRKFIIFTYLCLAPAQVFDFTAGGLEVQHIRHADAGGFEPIFAFPNPGVPVAELRSDFVMKIGGSLWHGFAKD
jgi:hypothetical protein